MTENKIRRVTVEEAKNLISLSSVDNIRYKLPGFILKVIDSSLEITHTDNSIPHDTFTTAFPFEFVMKGKKYLITALNNRLIIDEVQIGEN